MEPRYDERYEDDCRELADRAPRVYIVDVVLIEREYDRRNDRGKVAFRDMLRTIKGGCKTKYDAKRNEQMIR